MSLDLYPEIIHEGDLSPDAFGEEVDAICEEIHKATKGTTGRMRSLLDVSERTVPRYQQSLCVMYGPLIQKICAHIRVGSISLPLFALYFIFLSFLSIFFFFI